MSEKGEFPDTIGKLEVLSNIKGNAKGIVNFRRSGAVIEVSKYYECADPFMVGKQNYLREQFGRPPVEDDLIYINRLLS
ncbi:MAG: hypothetical protein ACK5KR_03605 [Breznakia sp.]